MQTSKHSEVLKIVVAYAIFGYLWIYFSDSVLSWISHDQEVMTRIALYSRSLFILCTSFLLFFLISRQRKKTNLTLTALQKSENHLQTLLQTIPDLIWSKDKNGVYLSCNGQFERYFGATQADIVGKTDYDFLSKDLADFFSLHDRKTMAAGKAICNEGWRTFANDNHLVLLETIKTPMYDSNGSLIGLLCIGRDITKRKMMEYELRQSEDKFRLTFNFSPDAANINRLDDGLYVEISEGFTRITGYTKDDVKGKTSFDLNVWVDIGDREKLIKGLKQKGFHENLETKFRRKDGRLFTGLMSARIISLEGEPHILSIARDITELKRHESELLKIEKLESLGILAGGIAHDFNNILTGIIGNISFAKVYLDATHKSAKPLAAAEKAAVRAGELAHQLLTFSRGGQPVKKLISPRHVIEEAFSLILHGSNVKGIVDIPDSIHAFEADEGQISQVFHNIIINATHAMPYGGMITATVRNETLVDDNILSLPPGTYLCFTFADQGCGIPEKDLTKIFDPYFTTKSTGNGLGLTSAYSIISKHGGQISVSSVVGKGTVFTIHLPSIGKIESKHQLVYASEQYSGQEIGSILVMDDDQVIREIATSLLDHLGYEVTTCADGQEAVDLYRQAVKAETPFSVVILDLTIPGGLGGKQAAEKILAEFPEACLIVSSGYSNDSIMSQYQDHGFIGAIAKPYSMNDLITALNSLPKR